MGTSTFEFSNRVFILAIVLTVIVGVGVFAGVWNLLSTDYEYDQISVDGNAIIEMTPDIATVSLAIVTENVDSAEAIKENTETMGAVLDAISKLGVLEEDVRTQSYSLSPSYEWIDDEYEEVGYEVYQSLEISVREFAILGDLISNTSEAGVNRFNGVDFDLEEYEAQLELARIEAIEEARAKADAISEASGAKLGKLISYYEYTDDYDYYYGKGGSYYDSYAMEGIAIEEAVMTYDQFQPGQEEITLTVNLSFRLK